jgi:membrane-associated phospholipid phosphatase
MDRGSVARGARAVALLVGAVVAGSASSSRLGRRLDVAAFRAVNRGHGTRADAVFAGVTELGSLYASAAAALTLAALGRPRAGAKALAAATGTWFVAQALKRAVGRPRPYQFDPNGTRRMIGRPPASSWPSSHPAVLTAFVVSAAHALELTRGARASLAGLAWGVAASRVYLGVHYPSDVISGVLLGRAVGELVVADGRRADGARPAARGAARG